MENTDNDSREATSSIKTIYDPSPYGFKVPYRLAFNGFLKDAMYTDARPDMNVYVYGETEFYDAPYFWWWNNGLRSSQSSYTCASVVTESSAPYNMCIPVFNPSEGFRNGGFSAATSSATHSLLPMRDE